MIEVKVTEGSLILTTNDSYERSKELFDEWVEKTHKSDFDAEECFSMLRYFWEEKGDIKRYCLFEKQKSLIKREFPDVVDAWDDYKESRNRLNRLL